VLVSATNVVWMPRIWASAWRSHVPPYATNDHVALELEQNSQSVGYRLQRLRPECPPAFDQALPCY